MMQNTLTIILFAFSILNLNAQTIYTDFDDFKDACAAAQPGDEIILAAGRYEAESVIISDVAGSPENPIIIRAEEIGADTLDNGTYFDLRHCSYITIQGFVINITEKSTTFKIQTCNNIRITQNILDGSGESYYKDNGTERNSSVWISIQSLWNDEMGLSHHNRIDHNILRNKQTLGNMIRIDGTNELYVSQYDVIEYNHFQNMGPRAENEMEAIRIGWSAMSESDGYCTVANNLFEECNGDPEIISVKCNKNTLTHNTFLRCEGTLSLRHGNASIVEGNFFLGEGAVGTGGVRIYGSDHRIINNYFEGLTGTKWDAPITLTYGDAEEGSGSLSNHFRIERALIANNTLVNNHHGIEIGYNNQEKYSKPPRDLILANNLVSSDTNSLVNYINPPENITWINNLMFATSNASLGTDVSFTEDEVLEQNPMLVWTEEDGLYRAGAETPYYSLTPQLPDSIEYDMDGQLRSASTQFGADEYQSTPVLYAPLSPKDVGPSLGEYLQLSAATLHFSVNRDTIDLSIYSNLDWEATSEFSWIILENARGTGNGFLRIIAEKNETGLIRNGAITVQSTNSEEETEITKSINLSQADKEVAQLSLSTLELNYTASGGSESVEISSNVNWTATASASWITFDPVTGSGSGNMSVSVEVNLSRAGRSGILSLSDGAGLEQTISISQEGSVGDEVQLATVAAIASTEQTDGGNIAANVIDGNLDNRWSGLGDGAYISLELAGSSKVSFVKIGLYKGSERQSHFDLQGSNDGITYFDLLTDISSEHTDEELTIYDFPDTTARFIRLVGHGNSSGDWNSYTEIEVWGWGPGVGSENKEFTDPFPSEIYPNPSNGKFTLAAPGRSEIYMLDLSGRVMDAFQMTAEKQTIDSGLLPGLYLVKIIKGNESVSRRLVIQ